jgi:hypothetical protein
MRIALVIYSYYKEYKESSGKRKAFNIYARKKWLRMHKSSYRKFKIIKCEKGIRREPDNEKPGVINKIIKNVRDINRGGCEGLSKYVRRQGSKNLYGFKPIFMLRDTFFILLNLILLNLTLLGVSHFHVLSYGLYQI